MLSSKPIQRLCSKRRAIVTITNVCVAHQYREATAGRKAHVRTSVRCVRSVTYMRAGHQRGVQRLSQTMIFVFIVGSVRVYREALAEAFEKHDEIRVIGLAAARARCPAADPRPRPGHRARRHVRARRDRCRAHAIGGGARQDRGARGARGRAEHRRLRGGGGGRVRLQRGNLRRRRDRDGGRRSGRGGLLAEGRGHAAAPCRQRRARASARASSHR